MTGPGKELGARRRLRASIGHGMGGREQSQGAECCNCGPYPREHANILA